MPQEPTFLNVTIMDNLKTANQQADEGAVNAAINAVGLRRYISETKDGYEAVVEKNGADLALGIRRRLALARALITNGKLIILDEPTGGLDAEGCAHASYSHHTSHSHLPFTPAIHTCHSHLPLQVR